MVDDDGIDSGDMTPCYVQNKREQPLESSLVLAQEFNFPGKVVPILGKHGLALM